MGVFGGRDGGGGGGVRHRRYTPSPAHSLTRSLARRLARTPFGCAPPRQEAKDKAQDEMMAMEFDRIGREIEMSVQHSDLQRFAEKTKASMRGREREGKGEVINYQGTGKEAARALDILSQRNT